MIENLMRAVIVADPAVTAIVGSGGSARVYALILPQVPNVTFPAITYQVISSVTRYSHDGPDIVEARVQVDCWALSFSAVKALARAVRDALHGYAGDPLGIQDFRAEIDRDLYESDTKLFRVSSDYMAYARDLAA